MPTNTPNALTGSMPALAPAEAPQRVGRFELIRLIGIGGMGEVHLASDPSLNRHVALKVIRRDIDVGADAADRMLDEAQAMAALNHPNAVTVYEAGTVGDTIFIAMEYVEGRTLAEWMEEEHDIEEIAHVFAAAGAGVAAAHHIGMVHRDFKPDNVLLGHDGRVCVTDFGLARLVTSNPLEPAPRTGRRAETEDGMVLGTPFYMSPEQFCAGDITPRSDQFSFCVALYEALYGFRPFDGATPRAVGMNVIKGNVLPPLGDVDVPQWLYEVVVRGLEVDPEYRNPSVEFIVDKLKAHSEQSGEISRQMVRAPYPGLSSFHEGDASRFFGRDAEIESAIAALREHTVLTMIGQSGAGKSSLVSAGLIPELRKLGAWEVLSLRPGRDPLARLARLVRPLVTMHPDLAGHGAERLLIAEPAILSRLLSSYALARQVGVLLVVDQFEEAFTLAREDRRSQAFFSALALLDDDPNSYVRTVLSMRSDLFERVSEHRALASRVVQSLQIIGPPDRAQMRDALIRPLEELNYSFESPAIVEDMLTELEGTAAALPLLQFAARTLWNRRDRDSRQLTSRCYAEMGRVSGLLASHADRVLARMSGAERAISRAMFMRLVTPQRTRDIVAVEELLGGADGAARRDVLDRLVKERLLSLRQRSDDDGAVAELVHESLVTGWPTLSRWLDESEDESGFVAQLRPAARQWEAKGRPAGLLWTGEAADEAQWFSRRGLSSMGPIEHAFLAAVVDAKERRRRRGRRAVAASMLMLVALVAAAVVVVFQIRAAQKKAEHETEVANKQSARAEKESARAHKAEAASASQLRALQEKEAARLAAEERATTEAAAAAAAREEVESGKEALSMTNAELRRALTKAKSERKRAMKAAAAERAAKDKLERLLKKERARVRKLERQRKKISTELN